MAKYKAVKGIANNISKLSVDDLRIIQESARNMLSGQDGQRAKKLLSDPEISNFHLELEQFFIRREGKQKTKSMQTRDISSSQKFSKPAPAIISANVKPVEITKRKGPEVQKISDPGTKTETNKESNFKINNINSMKTSIFRTLLKLKKEERLTAEELETKSIGDKIAEDAGIIHLLRDRMGLILPIALRSLIPGGTFGSEVLPGATNVFANSIINRLPYIPYQAKSGGTIAAVSESIAGFYDQNDEADDAAMTLATITHSPKRITAFIPFSAQLRMQSPEMQDQVLLKNLQRACSAALDRSVFGVGERSATVMQGVGYATRYGILSRINSISPNWNRIMELEETLMAANALPDGYFWITNPRGARRLKQTEIETGFPKVILEKGLIDNIPVLISSSVSNEGAIEGDADLLIMGNWNDLALIIYGGISFTLDDISRMRESIQTIIVDIFVDCKGLRAPLATSDDGSTQTNDYSSSFGVIPIAPSIGNQS